MKYFFGIIEDNVGLLNVHWVPVPLHTSEPILYKTFFFLANYIDSIFLYNFFLFIIFSLNFIFIYKFFKLFNFNRIQILISTLIISISPYFSYQFRSHFALINFWILVYYITNLISINFKNKKTYIYCIKTGIILGLCSLISNYLGFFGILVTVIYFLSQLFFSLKYKLFEFKTLIKNYLIIAVSFLIIFLSFNFNYFNELVSSKNMDSNTQDLFSREIDNFFIFSSRPWYYLLPSTDNPFLGKYSEKFLLFLEMDWGNFLAKNYFKSEHSASFLGLVNIFFGVSGMYYLNKKNNFLKNLKISFSENSKAISVFIITFSLILFTLPPYISIGGFFIYFPSYLLYELAPMFRVVARLGILILMFWFVFVNYGYIFIIEKFSFLNKKLYLFIFWILVVSITLIEFFIPIKITDVSNAPEVYKYLSKNSEFNSKIAIYPENKTTQGYFWKLEHKREIVNFAQNHYIDNTYISNDQLTKKIPTCEGIKNLHKLGVSYVIYFKNEDNKKETNDFFINNLKLIKSFDNVNIKDYVDYKFFSIQYTGDTYSNQASLYLIPNELEKNCIN